MRIVVPISLRSRDDEMNPYRVSIEDTWKCQFPSACLSVLHHYVITSTIVFQKSKIRWVAIKDFEFLAPTFMSLACAFHSLKSCNFSVSPTQCTFLSFGFGFGHGTWSGTLADVTQVSTWREPAQWTYLLGLIRLSREHVLADHWLLYGEETLKEQSCSADLQTHE